MLRATLPSGRKSLLLLAVAVAVIGGVWWWQRPPPEPVYQGRRLSEWMVPPEEGVPLDPQPSAHQIKAFGPAAVPWLAYQVEHGKHPFYKFGRLPFDEAPHWLRAWVPDRWGGLRQTSPRDERLDAAVVLNLFGPEAVPAIPALGRILERENESEALFGSVIETLYSIGPTAWPVLQQALQHDNLPVWSAILAQTAIEPARWPMFQYAIEHGCQPARQAAVGIIGSWVAARGVDSDGKSIFLSDADVARMVVSIEKACHDSDAEVRETAVRNIEECYSSRPETALFDSAILELARLLADPDSRVRGAAVDAIDHFGARATAAVPAMIERLDDAEPLIRRRAAWALTHLDMAEKLSAVRLHAMLHDPDIDCREEAERALDALGLSPKEEGAGMETAPAQ